MRIRDTVVGSTAVYFAIASGLPLAAEPADFALQVEPQTTAATISPELKSIAPADKHPLLGAPLDSSRLTTQRGGQDLIVNEQKLKATLTDNSASNLSTGNNAITDGAFAGTNGLPMVIQNSGNNVIIQNSTILNLNLK